MSAAASDMPDPLDDLVGCLHKLAELYGDEWAFSLIGKVRDHRGPGQAGQVRVALAQRIVEAEMRTTGDQDEAMRIVAERLGYHGWTRRNTFYKIARGITRHGKAIGDEEQPGRYTGSTPLLLSPAPATRTSATAYALQPAPGPLTGRARDILVRVVNDALFVLAGPERRGLVQQVIRFGRNSDIARLGELRFIPRPRDGY